MAVVCDLYLEIAGKIKESVIPGVFHKIRASWSF